MSLTVNKSIGKCFIHLAPGRVEIGGLHSLVSCWVLPSRWCCAWLGFALDPVWSCQCLWMAGEGTAELYPGCVCAWYRGTGVVLWLDTSGCCFGGSVRSAQCSTAPTRCSQAQGAKEAVPEPAKLGNLLFQFF